jgi:hypothetical protein
MTPSRNVCSTKKGTKMTDDDRKPESTRVDTRGDNYGQFSIGDDNTIIQSNLAPGPPLTEAELAELHQAVAALRKQVAAQAPPEKQAMALGLVDEVEKTVTAKEPDVSTMQYVRNWFTDNLPELAGGVVSLLLSPLVGKAVEAAGGVALAEYRRRF